MAHLIKIGACVIIAVLVLGIVWAVIQEYRLKRWVRNNITGRVRETKRTIKP